MKEHMEWRWLKDEPKPPKDSKAPEMGQSREADEPEKNGAPDAARRSGQGPGCWN